MKKITTLLLLTTALMSALPAAAVEGDGVMYVGGTVAPLKTGIIGHLDTSSETALSFESTDGKLAIPYAAVTSYRYSTEVTHHLGVLPAIAVGLVKKRQHRHFFRITYKSPDQESQVVVFEVSKHVPGTLRAVLDARVPKTDKCHSCDTSGNKMYPASPENQLE